MPEAENTPSNPLNDGQEPQVEESRADADPVGESGGELPETVAQPEAETAAETATESGGNIENPDPVASTEVAENQENVEVQTSQPEADASPTEEEQTTPDPVTSTPEAEVTLEPAEEVAPTSLAENEAAPVAENGDAPITATAESAPQAETPEAPAAETEEAVPSEEGEAEAVPDAEAAASGLLAEILGDEANFEAVVAKSNPNELALLLDNIAENGDVGAFISKVGLIKRTFDEKTDPETIETALLSRFNTSLARFNKKRSAYYAEREKEKEENSRKKYELLEQLKAIVKEEQVTKIQDVREIQRQWREIGWVLQKDLQPLNETYRQYLDVFYTLRGKYQELLDLDRRYNLDEKRKIIGTIEGLIPAEEGTTREEWNERSAKVKSLQEVWRSVGHVPRENIDEINTAFRDVLDRFYEMRSSYYELQDQQKGENAEKKKVLLESLKGFAEFASEKARDWNDATKKILAIQEEWKKIGPGPIDVNKQLWKDYRSVCDKFFERKGAFFKSFDVKRTENLAKKVAICEKAEALQESEAWRETAKVLKQLQEEWKTIGPVHERHSNKVWKRFRKACDTFFERRSAASNADRQSNNENLKTKEALIKQLQDLANGEDPAGKLDTFQEIQKTWKATGHVPFKVKDKINNAFKEAIGLYYKKSRLGRGQIQSMRLESNINSITDTDVRSRKINDEIRKIRGRLRGMEEKVQQYEINIQYISKGKSGKALRDQIQKQIDDEKARIAQLKKKVKDLRHMLENPPAPEPEKPAEEPAAPEAPAAEAETPTTEAEAPDAPPAAKAEEE